MFGQQTVISCPPGPKESSLFGNHFNFGGSSKIEQLLESKLVLEVEKADSYQACNINQDVIQDIFNGYDYERIEDPEIKFEDAGDLEEDLVNESIQSYGIFI